MSDEQLFYAWRAGVKSDKPVARCGPRMIDPEADTLCVIPATKDDAEFWGVERWHEESQTWEWIGDADDEDSAQAFAQQFVTEIVVETPFDEAVAILHSAVNTERGNWNMDAADGEGDDYPPQWLRDASAFVEKHGSQS